ncbi:MAG: hypothetical protein M0T74_13135 [Desulfitobacterium hafniense]|nr:hypothetical protein [Desulfitobacterium hafniense]
MSLYNILKLERIKVLERLQKDPENRAKWLVKLIDIDEQIEEMNENKS